MGARQNRRGGDDHQIRRDADGPSFDGTIAAGPYQIVLRRMNTDGKSYAIARLKVEGVDLS